MWEFGQINEELISTQLVTDFSVRMVLAYRAGLNDNIITGGIFGNLKILKWNHGSALNFNYSAYICGEKHNFYRLMSHRDNIYDVLFPQNCDHTNSYEFARNIFVKFMILRELLMPDCLYYVIKIYTDRRMYLDINNI